MAEGINLATAYVALSVSARGMQRQVKGELDGVQRQFTGAGDSAGRKFTDGFKRKLKVAAVVGGALLAAGSVKFLKGAISEASNLNESLNAVRVTYGKNAAGITKLGEDAAQALGLSKTEFNDIAVQFSSFSETIAGKGGDTVGVFDDLSTRGADFASVMNLDVNEALGLFQSGLAGETEPLRKFGIDLSAASVNAYAVREGLVAAGDEMTEQEKVQARYGFLMEQTANTSGDFANTSDDLANSQRRLGAKFDNIKAKIGAGLLPVLTKLSNYAADVAAPAIEKFIDEMQAGQGAGGRFAAGLASFKASAQVAFDYVKTTVLPVLKDFLDRLRAGDKSGAAGSFTSIGDSLKKLLPALGEFKSSLPAVNDALKVAAGVLKFFADNVDKLIKYMPLIVAAFVAFKVATLANTIAGRNSLIGLIAQITATRSLAASNRALAATMATTTGAQNAGTVATVRGRIAMVASAIAAKAKAAALKVVTVAQRLFNAALRANPIGIVITAIALLVGALVVLYKRNQTVKRVIDAAWAGIKRAVKAVVDWFVGSALPVIKTVFSKIGDAAKFLWTNVYKPYFTFILDKVKSVVGWITNKAYPRIRDAFKNIGSKAKSLWNDGIKPAFRGIRDTISGVWDKVKKVFDKFKSGIRSVKDAFGDAKDGIGEVWGKITGMITKPINAVIGAINTFTGGLETAINKIPGVKIDIGTIPKIGARRSSAPGKNVRPDHLAEGGPIRGFSPGGVTSKVDNIPIMARAKEWIINQGSSLRMERDEPGALAFINRTGRLPLRGFAAGGPVGGESFLDTVGDLAKGAFDILTDPKKAFKGLLNKALGGLGKSLPVTIAKGALSGVPEGLAGWLKDKLAASAGGGGSYSGKGGRWQDIVALIRGAGFSPNITSTVRGAGRRTLTGAASRHGERLAVDMSPNKAIQDFLWKIRNTFRELYMPDGRGWLLGKSRYAYDGAAATMANHMGSNAHIHAAFAQGGMVTKPFIADSGVTLARGLNVLDNRTGGPEPLGRLDQMGPMVITSGWLEVRGDGMARIADGRIEQARDHTAYNNRMVGQRG